MNTTAGNNLAVLVFYILYEIIALSELAAVYCAWPKGLKEILTLQQDPFMLFNRRTNCRMPARLCGADGNMDILHER